MVVDASAIVGILGLESDGSSLLERLSIAQRPIIPVHAICEATLALARKFTQPVEESEKRVRRFADSIGAEIIALDETMITSAIAAHARFGKGTGHPARLNMGDCFSYGAAKSLGMPLLFKGDDFSQTDIEAA